MILLQQAMSASKRKPDGGEANTYYIDPAAAGGGNGTIGSPYNSMGQFTVQSNRTYRFKGGTGLTGGQMFWDTLTNVFFTTYGEGKFTYTCTATGGTSYAIRMDNCTGCVVHNFDITGSANLYACIRNETCASTLVYDCILRDARLGSTTGGFGFRGGGSDIKIINTEIYNVDNDGILSIGTENIYIDNCNIHHVNQYYATDPLAGGDGIQLDGNWNGFKIRNTKVDRSDANTGNKFCIIIASNLGTNLNSVGVIEGCELINKSSVTVAIYAARGNGVIIRNNIFKGVTGGIRLSDSGCYNYLIYGNIFYDCTYGVGVANGTPTVAKVYNNVFYHVTGQHIWLENTSVDSANNIHVRVGDSGVAIHNNGGGSWTIRNNAYDVSATAGVPGLGTGSVVGDPLFVDAVNNDFHLQITSACLDAGIDVGITEDFEGNTNANLNMGVYF
jgi:hypothetical protein